MKILIVSHYFWPEAFRINEVAQALVKAGAEVTVLAGQPNYPEGNVFPGYSAWGTRSERHPDGFLVHRVPMAPRRKGRARSLVLNYLSFLASACALGPWKLRGQRFDAVFVYATTPVIHAIAGILIGRLKRAPVVTWVQDLWPESLEATGFIRNRTVLGAVRSVIGWIYRHNDLLLAQSRAFVGSVRQLAGTTPVEYHPNPGELAFSASIPPGHPALVLDAGFNVVFAGNLGTVQSLDTVIAAARLLQHAPGIRFVLVGAGSRLGELKAEIARLGLTNVQLAGRFPPEAMPGILAQASALLVSLVRSPIMSQTVPSKVQAYLAAGRPVIASLDGEGGALIEEAGAGIACPAEDAQALADAVLRLHGAAPETLAAMGRSGRSFYEQHFDPAQLADRLLARLRQLADSRPTGRAPGPIGQGIDP